MKRLLITLLAGMTACQSPDPLQPINDLIEKDVMANALGQDIGYEPIATTQVVEVTADASLNDWAMALEVESHRDTLRAMIGRWDEMIAWYRNEGDADEYHTWKFKQDRVRQALDVDGKDVLYRVYEHRYGVDNGLVKGARLEVVSYYFFDASNALMFRVTEEHMKANRREYIKTDLSPYEKAVFDHLVYS